MSFKLSIQSTGTYLPERVLTNKELENMVDTTEEWIVTRTGIRERRIANEKETTSYMGAMAARQALEKAQVDAQEVDLILAATFTPEAFFPSTACSIQYQIGAGRCAAFDLQAACSGFLYGLIVADQFIRSGAARTILLIGSEKLSSVMDWADRSTCVLFGDGAGAALIRADEKAGGLLSFQWGANGAHQEMLYLKNMQAQRTLGHAHGDDESSIERMIHGDEGGVRQTSLLSRPEILNTLEPSFLRMSGQEVFKQAVNAMASAAVDALKKAASSIEDMRCVICHQANQRIMEAIGDKLKIPKEKLFSNIQNYGNISAACIPVALHEAQALYQLKRGDKILLVAFGGGLTWAAAVLKW